MKIKLWVDDQRRAPAGWHHARTVTEAIRILATMEVEAVSLDHDIQFVREHPRKKGWFFPVYDANNQPIHSEETFEPVARFIAALSIGSKPFPVRIHTGNAEAATKMAQILTLAGFPVAIQMASEADYAEEPAK